MWRREWIQAGKYSSGYYPEKLPEPSKAGQYSSPGNTENTTNISSRRPTPRHIIVRFIRGEMKEKKLRAVREKGWVTHKGKPIRLTADLSAETLQARREWGLIFNILKEKNFQPRIWYPAKLSFINEGKIKFFANKQALRDFITTRPALQELLKEALHTERNNQYQSSQNWPKGKEYLHNEESISTSGQNSQLALNGNIKLTNININPKFKWIKCPN